MGWLESGPLRPGWRFGPGVERADPATHQIRDDPGPEGDQSLAERGARELLEEHHLGRHERAAEHDRHDTHKDEHEEATRGPAEQPDQGQPDPRPENVPEHLAALEA